MADQNPDVLAQIAEGKVVSQPAQNGQPGIDQAAEAAAVARGEAAIASGNQADMAAAQQDLAAVAPTSMAASTVAGNVQAAMSAQQTIIANQAAQQSASQSAITSNIPDLINAAVQGGVITTDQAAKLTQMASQTISAPPVEVAPAAPVIAGANIPAPKDSFVGQVADSRANAAKEPSVAA